MGPGKDKPMRNISDPPIYSPEIDLQEWRAAVGKWVDLMKAAHDEGTDRTYKTLYKILGRTLYKVGLPTDQQAIVDEAQDKGQIDYLQSEDPVKAVQEILKIVAVDPPIAMVTRLISSFQKVTSCRRGKSDDLRVFVSRFRGLAAKHLLYVNASSSSQIGDVVAITLLNNANLDSGTLTNAKIALINHAEARAKESLEDEKVQIAKKHKQELIESIDKLKNTELGIGVPSWNNVPNAVKVKIQDFYKNVKDLTENLTETMTEIESDLKKVEESMSVAKIFTAYEKRHRLHLDDAVSVLRNLTQVNQPSGPTFTKAEVQALVARQVQQALVANQGGQGHAPGSGSGSRVPPSRSLGRLETGRRSGNKRSRDDRSEDDVCYDCGKKGHYRGDTECKRPSFLTKKINERYSTQDRRPDSGGRGRGAPFFRRGSGSGFRRGR